jgi:glycerol-3-phosphate dehydrogenase
MTRAPGRLGPPERAAAWQAATGRRVDVVVVGGGIVGTGCALDAATRGLSVVLLEQHDLASGTSSRSSKLVHGGLRYLARGDLRLVREALRERTLLLTKLAPHLVSPLEFLLPLHRPVVDRAWVGSGVALYDALAARGANPLPRHRHLSRAATLARVPALSPAHLSGAIQFSDAQVDDARLTVAVARTAAAHGASILTSARVTGLVRDGERVTGVRAVDLEQPGSPERLLLAGTVVNATGVWSDEVESLAGSGPRRIRASKGVHLLVPRDRIESAAAMVLRTHTSVLFVLPWNDRWIVGTTDTDWRLDGAHPVANRTDVDYLLGELNRKLRRPIGHDDVVGVYAGLRPLLAGESEHTSALSREHAVFASTPGLVTIAGGKLTTYRVMAADTIDHLCDTPSVTERVPLVGAEGWAQRFASAPDLARNERLPVAEIMRLLHRYGSRIDDVLALVHAEPDLARPLDGATSVWRAEVVHAATHEGSLHLDDVLTRRTHLSIECVDRGAGVAPVAASLLAPVLGWDRARVQREVDLYAARVEAARASEQQPDDASAHAAWIAGAGTPES